MEPLKCQNARRNVTFGSDLLLRFRLPATALEMGTRPGPVKERVAAIQSGFAEQLRAFAATAVEQHELPAREDPGRLAFELHAILLGADTKFVLHDDPAVLDLARQVIRQRLGPGNGTNAGES